jgi:hypothetical protein
MPMRKELLVIGQTFPEPGTTAAGVRMMQLIDFFIAQKFSVTFATTAALTEYTVDLKQRGVKTQRLSLNDPSFDRFIKALKPDIVLFDRFITEEQFGWRVTAYCPEALRILDTEDLHFLRKARAEALKHNRPVSEADLYTDLAKREIASILRSDLSLIISEKEMEILQLQFKIPDTILLYLPFLVEPPSEEVKEDMPDFKNRTNFVTIGNMLHAPNLDSVLYLKNKIWPGIRNELPNAEMHIYGAYATRKISELHDDKQGFILKGWVEDADTMMQQARVCLAPLRFGAGLKGKLVTAMKNGTPCVTTGIGAEGIPEMRGCEDEASFISASVELYTEKNSWIKQQAENFRMLQDHFSKESHSQELIKRIFRLTEQLGEHRKQNFIGQILQHHTLQSTKYLSKWIEAKRKDDYF